MEDYKKEMYPIYWRFIFLQVAIVVVFIITTVLFQKENLSQNRLTKLANMDIGLNETTQKGRNVSILAIDGSSVPVAHENSKVLSNSPHSVYMSFAQELRSAESSGEKVTKQPEPLASEVISSNATVMLLSESDSTYVKAKINSQLQSAEDIESSLNEKLDSFVISKSADVSKSIGFTEAELKLLLINSELIADEEMIDVLSSIIPATVQEYEVNELLCIAVMSLESAYFKSGLARKNYNYGGMMAYSGNFMKFDSMEEGVEAAVICIHNNLKGENCTISDVARTYCPSDVNWPDNVRYIMLDYANSIE